MEKANREEHKHAKRFLISAKSSSVEEENEPDDAISESVLPSPTIFKGYENVLPGAANRILRMAEKQSIHRQSIEKQVAKTKIQLEWISMFFAYSLSLVLTITGAFLIYTNKENVIGYLALFAPLSFNAVNYLMKNVKK